MENEKEKKAIIIMLSIIAVMILVVCIIIGVSNIISNQNNKTINVTENEEETVDDTLTNVLEEEVADFELPKIEINTIADTNSTINGEIPCYYNPVIPKGFKAINYEQDETISEEANWLETNGYLYGLVIEDESGNQFVWVPVEDMDMFKTTDWQKNTAKGTIDSTYVEPETSEEDEYNVMYQKVGKYGGFYIGRYETGDESAQEERTTTKNSDYIAIKRGLYIYTYVPYEKTTINNKEITGAKELASKFSVQNNYIGIKTSVVYGVQWDAMLRFVASEENNVNNSISWGNYSSSELNYTINGEEYTKKAGEVKQLLSGISEQTKSKNIYDIAGNVYEWTAETAGSNVRVVRGGSYVTAIGQLAASRYAYNQDTANNAIGFRISFYIY
jgi:hypothetical protein